MATAKDIVGAAMALPEKERAEVVFELLDSLDPPDPQRDLDDEAWVAEVKRRAQSAARGESRGSTWEETRARISRAAR